MRWIRPAGIKLDQQARRYYLSHSEFFQDIDWETVEEIEPSIPMVQASKGHTFFLPGDGVDGLYIVKKGRVKLFRIAPDGRVLTIAILKHGGVFGKMSVLGLAAHGTGAEALDDALVCIMPRELAREFIMSHPSAGLRLLSQLEMRLEDMEERLEDFSFGTVTGRLAKLLLQLDHEGHNVIDDFTHQQIADILGVYRETVSQVLSTMRNDGIIELGRKHIAILDRSALQKLADSKR